MSKKLLSIPLSTFIIFCIAFMAYLTYDSSLKYDNEMFSKAQNFKVEKKLDNYIENINNAVWENINKYLSDTTLEEKQMQKSTKSTIYKEDMYNYIFLYFIAIFILFLTYFISLREIFVVSLITVSLISWLVGVMAPIMTIEIFSELPVFGFTIFKYDSKSIVTTVEKLWLLQNYFVSVMVGVFSILIPLIKTLALYFSTFMKRDMKFIEFIGKWAMADVFVVALLITNLSLNADEFTNAKVQVAIYFFSTYVILSMLASFLIKQNLKKEAIS